MLEKFGKISNPLTIIAIFAGLAEVLGIGVLPFIGDLKWQGPIVFFVAFFPFFLVALFFTTLILKQNVLYAPSDFNDQAHYLAIQELEKKQSNIDHEITTVKQQLLAMEAIGVLERNSQSDIRRVISKMELESTATDINIYNAVIRGRLKRAVNELEDAVEILNNCFDNRRAKGIPLEVLDSDALYNIACYKVLLGHPQDAFGFLEQSIQIVAEHREDALADPDFATVLTDPKFIRLTENQTSIAKIDT